VIAENRLVSCHNQSIVLYTHAACAVAAPQRNGRVSVRPSLCLTVLSIDRSTGGARFAAERPASSRYRRTAAGAVLQEPAFSGSNGAAARRSAASAESRRRTLALFCISSQHNMQDEQIGLPLSQERDRPFQTFQ